MTAKELILIVVVSPLIAVILIGGLWYALVSYDAYDTARKDNGGAEPQANCPEESLNIICMARNAMHGNDTPSL